MGNHGPGGDDQAWSLCLGAGDDQGMKPSHLAMSKKHIDLETVIL